MNLSNLIIDHPLTSGLTVAGLIVLFGLFVYGGRDLFQFGPRRVWALGGVVFRENIRRKVLWLTPLVMLAIVVLTGLQQADDAQDSIRQTLQFSMFASGLLVVVTGVMLACTNLPRDIESKVIFTIVVKPVTRLEIILGKILGFARVTAAILLLMGCFTWAYVHVRAWQLDRAIAVELDRADRDAFEHGRLEYLHREGLLGTRNLAQPTRLEMVAREPEKGDDLRWASTNQSFLIPFRTIPSDLVPAGVQPANGAPQVEPGANGLRVTLNVRADQVNHIEHPELAIHPPMLPDPDAPSVYGDASFVVSVVALDTDDPSGGSIEIAPATAQNDNRAYTVKPDRDGRSITFTLDPRVVGTIAQVRGAWGLTITPSNDNYLLGMRPGEAKVVVPGATEAQDRVLTPYRGVDNNGPTLLALGSSGRSGRLVEGPREGFQSLALAHFDGPAPKASATGNVTVELTMDVERNEDDSSVDTTQVAVEVRNADGSRTPAVLVTPEQRKTTYAEFPASAFNGGKYDVVLKTVTQGHSVSLTPRSFAVVQSRHSFAGNLAKALLSQWMLSVLVVTIGMFCSTFLSWPIAIVLNLVLLMGHWAVNQVSDSLQPGIGALLATDVGATDPTDEGSGIG